MINKNKITSYGELYSIYFSKNDCCYWRNCILKKNKDVKGIRKYICNSLNLCDNELLVQEKYDCFILEYSFKDRNDCDKGIIEKYWLDGLEYALEITLDDKKEYKIFIADFDYPKESVHEEISKMYPDVPIKIDLVDEVWIKRNDIFEIPLSSINK
ncbi:hypothetical protein FG877_00150 [Enterococcus casseliflavus]|nr:hypothetical protein [Enterococcus casseliflavus]